ncbi:FkbM family methyltransferase [Rhodobacteraceae bacterium NNCM2]|nr:FkbM family methyltransferase [Coraliihabitans acroporae]
MTEPPYGTFALPAPLEGLRRYGIRSGRGAIARRLTSLIRRICLIGRADPFDVEPFPGQCARLYPRDNLSEKRVFGASQFWDHAERKALEQAVKACADSFCFVDAGANVGLYTLAVRSAGPIRGIAIEPDPENLRRLRFNLAASGASDVSVAACALADESGTIRLAVSAGNRGEISANAAAEGGESVEVPARPLLDVVTDAGLTRIDALKIDIEGMEEPVLSAFFDTAPASLRPGMIILEARRGEVTPALALLHRNGYIASQRTKLNVILTPSEEEKEQPDGKA